MKKKIKIHFVCSGNVYRSRIAEAYLKSIAPELEVSSSGIHTEHHLDEDISSEAMAICKQHGILDFASLAKTQTTNDILNSPDVIIFLSQKVRTKTHAKYDFNPYKCLTWNIKDVEDWKRPISISKRRKLTFSKIKDQVDELLNDINNGLWVDIVTSENQPAGCSLPINIANYPGGIAWHRGCHAVITTPDEKTLIQKRSSNVFFLPNTIDVSLGGIADAGETPIQTMVRETKEEIGIDVAENDLEFLEIFPHMSCSRKHHRTSRTFTYTYHIKLADNNPQLVDQESEVSTAEFLSKREIKMLLRRRRLTGLGNLIQTYDFFERILKASKVI